MVHPGGWPQARSTPASSEQLSLKPHSTLVGNQGKVQHGPKPNGQTSNPDFYFSFSFSLTEGTQRTIVAIWNARTRSLARAIAGDGGALRTGLEEGLITVKHRGGRPDADDKGKPEQTCKKASARGHRRPQSKISQSLREEVATRNKEPIWVVARRQGPSKTPKIGESGWHPSPGGPATWAGALIDRHPASACLSFYPFSFLFRSDMPR